MINNPSPKRNTHLVGKKRLKVRYLLLILMGFIVLCVSRPYNPPNTQFVEHEAPEAPAELVLPSQETKPVEPPVTVEEKRVRRGDTLYDILRAKGLSDSKILAISNRKVDGIGPSRLVVGKSYRLYIQDGQVTEYQYEPDDKRILRVLFGEDRSKCRADPL